MDQTGRSRCQTRESKGIIVLGVGSAARRALSQRKGKKTPSSSGGKMNFMAITSRRLRTGMVYRLQGPCEALAGHGSNG